MENKDTFSYTYSASEQDEIQRIREKYMHKEADEMERLRRLDKSVTRKAVRRSLLVGVISALIMGTGMSCVLVWQGNLLLPGILIGLIGIAGVASAYPVYARCLRKGREKAAPEILRLSDALLR